jgi:hypothetical protein
MEYWGIGMKREMNRGINCLFRIDSLFLKLDNGISASGSSITPALQYSNKNTA